MGKPWFPYIRRQTRPFTSVAMDALYDANSLPLYDVTGGGDRVQRQIMSTEPAINVTPQQVLILPYNGQGIVAGSYGPTGLISPTT
jgi:hypothetical protein